MVDCLVVGRASFLPRPTALVEVGTQHSQPQRQPQLSLGACDLPPVLQQSLLRERHCGASVCATASAAAGHEDGSCRNRRGRHDLDAVGATGLPLRQSMQGAFRDRLQRSGDGLCTDTVHLWHCGAGCQAAAQHPARDPGRSMLLWVPATCIASGARPGASWRQMYHTRSTRLSPTALADSLNPRRRPLGRQCDSARRASCGGSFCRERAKPGSRLLCRRHRRA